MVSALFVVPAVSLAVPWLRVSPLPYPLVPAVLLPLVVETPGVLCDVQRGVVPRVWERSRCPPRVDRRKLPKSEDFLQRILPLQFSLPPWDVWPPVTRWPVLCPRSLSQVCVSTIVLPLLFVMARSRPVAGSPSLQTQ